MKTLYVLICRFVLGVLFVLSFLYFFFLFEMYFDRDFLYCFLWWLILYFDFRGEYHFVPLLYFPYVGHFE